MNTPFRRTLRSLDREPRRLTIVTLSIIGLLVAAWAAAAFWVPVPVRVASGDARLIAADKPMPLHATRGLHTKHIAVDLGDQVAAGQLLVVLDPGSTPAELEALSRQMEALADRRDTLEHERVATAEMAADEQHQLTADRQQVEARLSGAESRLAWLESEHRRQKTMSVSGAVSQRDLQQSVAEITAQSAIVAETRAELASAEAAVRAATARSQVELTRLEGRLAELAIQMADYGRQAETLRVTIQQSRVVAPVAGSVGAMADLGPGATVEVADWLLTIVPESSFEVEARFDSRDLGQLQLGQLGRLRLESFPWARYGTVEATLVRLGTERRDGSTVARFALGPEFPPDIPLQHGLEGYLEVEVRRVPVAHLLLEAIGRIGTG